VAPALASLKLVLADSGMARFKALVEETGQSRFERIVHMIESHEALIDACSGNEIKFRAVLETLNESLGVDDRSGDSDGQHR